jgi:hypothetical protein
MKSHPGFFGLIAVGGYRPKGASGIDEDKGDTTYQPRQHNSETRNLDAARSQDGRQCAFFGLLFVVVVPVL